MIAMAIADTAPTAYVVLLARDDIPAAFATGVIAEVFASNLAPASPSAARRLAEHGWVMFRKLADQAGHKEHGTGADMSATWPILKEIAELQPDPEKVRRIALLAGRMYDALKGAKARRTKQPDEIVGIKTGSDFQNLIPAEYALLGTAPTKHLLFQAISERKAIEYERTGTSRKARGPLVLVLDESGSMRHASQKYERDDWAKAAMTALTRIAWEDKRPVIVVHFSTSTRAVVLKPGDHAGLVRAQHTFLDGGTDIATALEVGLLEVANLAAAGHAGADVVLISDGGDASGWRLQPALSAMKAQNVRLWSIAIDMPFHGDLKDQAAEYVHLSDADMSDASKTTKIVAAV
jgi:uncharacterized protein with von Willebrand factor type A (vWA) domain